MKMSPPLRRSTRTHTATKKYNNDGWGEATHDSILASSESELSENNGAESSVRGRTRKTNSAHSLDGSEVVQDDAQSSSPQPTPHIDSRRSKADTAGEAHSSKKTSTIYKGKAMANEDTNHFRGLQSLERRMSKRAILHAAYGPTTEDTYNIEQARNRWHFHGRDAVFPSEASLKEALKKDWLLGSGSAHGAEYKAQESQLPQPAWSRQNLKTVTYSELEARSYMPRAATHEWIANKAEQQRKMEIPPLNYLNTATLWQISGIPDEAVQNMKASPGSIGQSAQHPPAHELCEADQHAWLLNVGEKVQSIAWMSDRDSLTQYLAVTCRATNSQRNFTRTEKHTKAPAFTATAGYPSNLQVWEFRGYAKDTSKLLNLSSCRSPRLIHVFGCAFGDIKDIRWLPSAVNHGEIGVLGMLSTDGELRMLKIPASRPDMTCFEIQQVALHIESPPGVLFTAFTFCGDADLLLGASDGTLRAYNIADMLSSGSVQGPVPYLQIQLHHTYVLQLVSPGAGMLPEERSRAGGLDLSNFLVSTSAAGDIRLTDLLAPEQDSIILHRTRLPTRNLIYQASTTSFITTIDRSGRTEAISAQTAVVMHQLRHFYNTFYLSKFESDEGTATAIAGSRLHPYILVGNSRGSVYCQNVLKKITNRAGGWICKIFDYDWIPSPRYCDPREDFNDEEGEEDEEYDISQEPTMGDGMGADNSATVSSRRNLDDSRPVARHLDRDRRRRRATIKPRDDATVRKINTNRIHYGRDVRPGRSRFVEGFQAFEPELAKQPSARVSAAVIPKNEKKTPKSRAKSRGKAKEQDKSHGESESDNESDTDANNMMLEKDIEEEMEADEAEEDDDIDAMDIDPDSTSPSAAAVATPKTSNKRKRPSTSKSKLTAGMNKAQTEAKAQQQQPQQQSSTITELIFEEEQAITCLAWNENPRCASWVAIGFGSGLLRVEDLSVDL